MRCVACDNELNNKESTTKFLYSGKYTDMCSRCLKTIVDIAPTEDSPVFADDDNGEQDENHDQA